MPSRVRELRSFQGLIDAVAAAGIQPPREYMQLRGRLGQLQSLVLSDDRPMLDRLTAAVITGGSAEKSPLSELLVLARAEQGRVNLEPVLVHVFAATLTEMQRVYAPHAQANYRAIPAKFNTTAKAFTSCAGVIDPGSAPDEVLAGDARSITIWHDALTRAAELDKLLEPLAAAAELWRGPNEPVGLGVSRDPFTITLVADVEHLNKRHVWAA